MNELNRGQTSKPNKRAVANTVIWIILTVLIAECLPMVFVWCNAPAGKQRELLLQYLGNSVLVLVAFGVFLAVVSDILTEWRSPIKCTWVGFLLLGVTIGYLAQNTVVKDFVRKEQPGQWDTLVQVIIVSLTLIFCATEKFAAWYAAYEAERVASESNETRGEEVSP